MGYCDDGLSGGGEVISEDTIKNYFHLHKRIQKTKQRMIQEEIRFNSRNYYTCIQEVQDEVRTVAFRIDREVTDYVTSIQQAELYLEILYFKQDHFNRFMHSLNYQEREYLYQRYKNDLPTINDRLDEVISDEVQEIEDAIQLRYGDLIREITKTEIERVQHEKKLLPQQLRNFLELNEDSNRHNQEQSQQHFETFLQA